MSNTSAAPETRKPVKSLWAGSLAHFIHDGCSDMLYLFFPLWQAQFALSFAEIGILKTLFSGTMASLQVPASSLAPRLGAENLLAWGTLLLGAAMLFLGNVDTIYFVGFLLVLGGLGSSTQHPMSSALISDAYEQIDLRRKALSTFNVAGDLGKLALPATGAFIVSQSNWMSAAQAAGVATLCIAGWLFFYFPHQKPSLSKISSAPSEQPTAAIGGWLNYKPCWSLSSIGVIDSATRMGFLTFFPFLLQQKGGSIADTGIALSLIFAGGACGKLACGRLALRIGVLRSVILTEIVTALCIVSTLFLPLLPTLLLAPLLGVALNGTSSVLYGSVPELVPPTHRQKAFAIFYTMTIGSGAISPFLYGLAGDVIGLSHVVLLLACIVLATLPLTLPLRNRLRTEGT